MTAAEPVAAPAAEPPVVPGYTLHARLGRGGSGEVWRATPRRGGPPVAVKVLVDGDPARQAREAALLGELDHPHLVRLIEVVHQPRRGDPAGVALVLDLLEGGSLASLIARRGRLRPGEVVTAIAPVAAALAHAHGNGVVHGDLSPGNIVFTAEGRPVLTDLGVARVLGETAAAEVTPAYVDPTVARGAAPGPASDVFGIAAAAFHALTGVAPWNAATPEDTLRIAADGRLPDLAELAPDAPPALLAVVARGLAADPHDRGSAAAFALDLRHACRPEPVRLPTDGVPDAELALTGRGPRTELTHQVPGRRRHAAPIEAPAPRGRWIRRPRAPRAEGGRSLRRLPAVAAAIVVSVVAVVVAGHSALAGRPAQQRSAAALRTTVPDPIRGPSQSPSPSPSPSPFQPPPPSAAAVDTGRDPGSLTGWTAVIATLYGRRAAAFGAPSVDGGGRALAGVYAPGCRPLAADEAQIRALARGGEMLRGFTPTVVEVTRATATGGRAELLLRDRWPRYDVVPAGQAGAPPLRTGPARPSTNVRMVLQSTAAGWRIAEAERLT
jgi:eukaryotic-like serine/threonine-protein kinase